MRLSTGCTFSYFFVLLGLLACSAFGFAPGFASRRYDGKRSLGYRIYASSSRNSGSAKKKPIQKEGYQFGDITKGVLGKVKQNVNSITGKSTYQFGDLSRYLDQQAKQKATEFTKKQKYEFGDVSKELVQRIRTGDYTEEEMLLLLKLVLTVGIQFQPIARLLPVKALVQMLNLSMSQKFTHQIQQILAKELESRLQNKFGENMKSKLFEQAVLKFTGKEKYQLGDITTAMNQQSPDQAASVGTIAMNSKVEKELDAWENSKTNKK